MLVVDVHRQVSSHPNAADVERIEVWVLRHVEGGLVGEASQLDAVLACHVIVILGVIEDAAQRRFAVDLLHCNHVRVELLCVLR
jgi:hypothetical protein